MKKVITFSALFLATFVVVFIIFDLFTGGFPSSYPEHFMRQGARTTYLALALVFVMNVLCGILLFKKKMLNYSAITSAFFVVCALHLYLVIFETYSVTHNTHPYHQYLFVIVMPPVFIVIGITKIIKYITEKTAMSLTKKRLTAIMVALLLPVSIVAGNLLYNNLSDRAVQRAGEYRVHRLEMLFDYVEDDLNRFTAYIIENDLLETLGGVSVSFQTDRETAMRDNWPRDRERLVFYNGELIEETTTPRIIELLAEDDELYYVFKVVSERGVISSISISQRAVSMHFHILREQTPFLRTSARFEYEPGRSINMHSQIRGDWFHFVIPW